MMKNMDAALAAFDAARAAGASNAQALAAAAEVEGRFINDVFNDMLDADVLRFVFVDRRKVDPKNGEGGRLVRVVDVDGRRVVDSHLVK